VSLNKSHFDSALKIWINLGQEEYKSAGFKQPQFKINVSHVYKGQFTFP